MADANHTLKDLIQQGIKHGLAAGIFAVGFALGTELVGPFFENYLATPVAQFAARHHDQILLQLLFVLLVVFAGVGLFILRSAYRRTYAIIEIFVGIFAATYSGNELFSSAAADSQVKAVFAALGGVCARRGVLKHQSLSELRSAALRVVRGKDLFPGPRGCVYRKFDSAWTQGTDWRTSDQIFGKHRISLTRQLVIAEPWHR